MISMDPASEVTASRRLHDAAWPDMFANLQTAYAELTRAQSELRGRATEVEEGRDLFRLVIESISDALFLLDRAGRVEICNPAAGALVGRRGVTLIGRPFVEVCGTTEIPVTAWQLLQRAHNGRLQGFEATVQNASGHRISVSASVGLIRDRRDKIVATVIVAQDITERKAAELAIREARDEAERANRAKSEFLSRMSHELRTPMNAILGFAQLLAMDPLGPQERKSVDHILNAGKHLRKLINEVLDISKIESGRQEYASEPVHAGRLIQEVLDLIRPLAGERQIQVQVERTAAWDQEILVDPQRLKQVLLNLAANAIKYNQERGTVSVRCDQVERNRLRIRVTDTGLGIPPDKLPRLFSPFDRLEAETTGVEGTGLGLSLSKVLVEAMGGSIGVESEVGQGSCFWIEMPAFHDATGQPAAVDESLTAAGRSGALAPAQRVLYIEDNPSNYELVERIFERWPSVTLFGAGNGARGLALAREQRLDLILLDLHLPDSSGLEVLRRLRADPQTSQMPVVIISADATPGRHDHLLTEGAQA
ncbi:MAG: ATP-binding protein, partial [Dehalococcoidia bacterium]